MPAATNRIFRVPPLQEAPRFLVTFSVQVVQQVRVGAPGQLSSEIFQPREKRLQVGFWIRRRHALNCLVQLDEGLQYAFFNFRHIITMLCEMLLGQRICL